MDITFGPNLAKSQWTTLSVQTLQTTNRNNFYFKPCEVPTDTIVFAKLVNYQWIQLLVQTFRTTNGHNFLS